MSVCAWRLIAGIGVELVTIDTCIAEMVPKQIRGRAFAYNQTLQFAVVPVVASLAYILVLIAPYSFDGWHWVVVIGSAGALFVWFLRLSVLEGPRWLLQQGRVVKAGTITSAIEAKVVADLRGAPLPVAARTHPRPGATSSA